MLATEEPSTPTGDRRTTASSLENWAQNEPMRHIPSLAWIIQKVDGDVRRRIEKLWTAFADVPFSHPGHAELELEFRALCRNLERIADTARNHHGHPHPPNELGTRVSWTVNDVVAALRSVDAETFGRRFPFHTAERSNSEPLWAAVLATIQQIHQLVELVRVADPTIDEQMYEGLVQLQEPLRREPIA